MTREIALIRSPSCERKREREREDASSSMNEAGPQGLYLLSFGHTVHIIQLYLHVLQVLH